MTTKTKEQKKEPDGVHHLSLPLLSSKFLRSDFMANQCIFVYFFSPEPSPAGGVAIYLWSNGLRYISLVSTHIFLF